MHGVMSEVQRQIEDVGVFVVESTNMVRWFDVGKPMSN